jgi:hypothetical protein
MTEPCQTGFGLGDVYGAGRDDCEPPFLKSGEADPPLHVSCWPDSEVCCIAVIWAAIGGHADIRSGFGPTVCEDAEGDTGGDPVSPSRIPQQQDNLTR